MRFHSHFSPRFLAWAAPGLFSLAALAAGCSSSPSDTDPDGPDDSDGGAEEPYCGAGPTCPASAEGVDLESPVVSFKTDVFPIFQRSCNDDTQCHGTSSRGNVADMDLGPEEGTPTDDQLANIVADLVNNTPVIGPVGMKNVVPGDWQNSFLMIKVDGCQNSLDLDCPGTAEELNEVVDAGLCSEVQSCGTSMPNYGTDAPDLIFPMSEVDRHTIRRWIQQGAQPN